MISVSLLQVRVKPGESALAFYTAENQSKTPITGVSTYNVTPMKVLINTVYYLIISTMQIFFLESKLSSVLFCSIISVGFHRFFFFVGGGGGGGCWGGGLL